MKRLILLMLILGIIGFVASGFADWPPEHQTAQRDGPVMMDDVELTLTHYQDPGWHTLSSVDESVTVTIQQGCTQCHNLHIAIKDLPVPNQRLPTEADQEL